jgi:hypothetical protein
MGWYKTIVKFTIFYSITQNAVDSPDSNTNLTAGGPKEPVEQKLVKDV